MKKRLQGLLAGLIAGVLLTTGVVYAANTTTLYDVMTSGIRIVLDGKDLKPTDANGNRVEPFIYNGTTYLPVRAIATALGKPVYWNGPEFTVYLGDMDGKLEYPTKELTMDDDIGGGCWTEAEILKDNLGNSYSRAIYPWLSATNDSTRCYEKLCNMKYSRFKGTLYVMNGCTVDESTQIIIKTDDKTVWKSPEMTKRTAPIEFDIDITGCYDLQIYCMGSSDMVAIGDAGFYQ